MSGSEIDKVFKELPSGVYYGYAFIDDVKYPMAMSIGDNPVFQNNHWTLEVNILQQIDDPLYDKTIKISITGWIREQFNFGGNIEILIREINKDLEFAKQRL